MKMIDSMKQSEADRVSRNEACARSVVLAADDISKLRKVDVLRVIADYYYGTGSTQEFIDYLSEFRPDLVEEAKECEKEILP